MTTTDDGLPSGLAQIRFGVLRCGEPGNTHWHVGVHAIWTSGDETKVTMPMEHETQDEAVALAEHMATSAHADLSDMGIGEVSMQRPRWN